ncbi:BLF1 family deaminating toxin (plasmid) [Ralstonia sp. R-29]|uniref:BLF1 family deaminating toxin n=1 Tax=Ralstonia sp. R-29 TaxID=3404059 RepID=UPI003CEB7F77
MTGGADQTVEFDAALNGRYPGLLDVYLHATQTGFRIDLDASGEAATILWLPWKQGELTALRPDSIARAAAGTLFFTYDLSGCKLFSILGGPVFHIDALVSAEDTWQQISGDEWVEENWEPGSQQQVTYVHRGGQDAGLWDLSAYLVSDSPPSTYGNGNVGSAIVGGVVNANQQLDLYMRASPWASLTYASQTYKSK